MLKNVFGRALALGICGAIMASSSSMAAVMYVSTADGNGADTSLQNDGQNGGTSATVFGAGATADFRRYDDVRQKMLLLRFDISDLNPAAYNDAILRLDGYSNRGRDLRVYGIADGALDNWDEATTSYSNAPGILQPGDGGPAYDSAGFGFQNFSQMFLPPGNPPVPAAYPLGLLPVEDTDPTPGYKPFVSNPTDLPLGDFLAADTNGIVSFLIHHDITHSSQTGNIRTKESGGYQAPMLGVVPPNFIPEPSSYALVLLGIGAVGMIVRRR